jgi:hypothetical protein
VWNIPRMNSNKQDLYLNKDRRRRRRRGKPRTVAGREGGKVGTVAGREGLEVTMVMSAYKYTHTHILLFTSSPASCENRFGVKNGCSCSLTSSNRRVCPLLPVAAGCTRVFVRAGGKTAREEAGGVWEGAVRACGVEEILFVGVWGGSCSWACGVEDILFEDGDCEALRGNRQYVLTYLRCSSRWSITIMV